MYDVIIVGGGVSGLSAAIFTAKSGLNTLVFDTGKAQITRISSAQNIPGFPEGISGKEWIRNTRTQVEKFNGSIIDEEVIEVTKEENGTFHLKTEKDSYQTKYLIIASNINKDILNGFDFEEKTNAFVPSGKAKAIEAKYNGETKVENLYLAGLINEIPSQISVSLGHGALVGITVVSKEQNKPYMWHDV